MFSATLNNQRTSPRKVRLVSDLIKGKTVLNALDILSVTPKRAADPITKLLQSAIANAKMQGASVDSLVV
ncbi:MAG TPA: uL22 family ribosomal protein, partial [Candidatus Paceibacterota bacterium]|nr:uL22 family ribosomal protein [Candidatus Paceibacterota bacterium]